MLFARHLNVLSRGDVQAQVLGVEVRPLRAGIYVASSVLTAVAVTSAGSIGFVGLVVPHLVRLAGARDHRRLLPGATLAGVRAGSRGGLTDLLLVRRTGSKHDRSGRHQHHHAVEHP